VHAIGDVIIEAGALIWPGAIVRGDLVEAGWLVMGAIALLGVGPVSQDGLDQRGGLRADRLRPADDPRGRPLQMALMGLGHVGGVGGVAGRRGKPAHRMPGPKAEHPGCSGAAFTA
jgi:hypothetical protein